MNFFDKIKEFFYNPFDVTPSIDPKLDYLLNTNYNLRNKLLKEIEQERKDYVMLKKSTSLIKRINN